MPVRHVFSTTRTIVFQCGEKWGFLFFQENNEVLERIRRTGWKIQHFVGICDGCSEGGNHECVHEDPFLGKLLGVSSDQMDYFTDHSAFLQRRPGWGAIRAQYVLHRKHADGRDFTLKSLLVLLPAPDATERSETIADKLAVLRFPGRRRLILPGNSKDASGDLLPLGLLAPFRKNYARGILAHYEVEASTD